MASGGPPDRMSPKHRLMALLAAAGQTHAEIAEAVGLHPGRVGSIAGSPLFQALVREFQGEMLARVADVTARLHAEAAPTLAKLVALRDGAMREETQLSAANSLADRIPALSRKTQPDERTLRVLLSADVEPLIEAIALSKGQPSPRSLPPAPSSGPGHANGNSGNGPARRIAAPPLEDVLAHWPDDEVP